MAWSSEGQRQQDLARKGNRRRAKGDGLGLRQRVCTFTLDFPGIRAMHALAVVAESDLGEALWVTGRLGPLGPRVTIGMQRHPYDAGSLASLLEFSRSVSSAHPPEMAADIGSVETPSWTIPVRLVGRKIDKQLGKIEFENLGRKARLQGPLGAGRIDEPLLQAELDPGDGSLAILQRQSVP